MKTDIIEEMHAAFAAGDIEVIAEALGGLEANTRIVAELAQYVSDDLILALIRSRDEHTRRTAYSHGLDDGKNPDMDWGL